jgi:hypothetical protein
MNAQLELSDDEVARIANAVTERVLAALGGQARPDPSSLTEPQAAELLGLRTWQLRDLRRKGKVAAFTVGRNSPRYTKQSLMDYQQQNSSEAKEDSRNGRHSKPAT